MTLPSPPTTAAPIAKINLSTVSLVCIETRYPELARFSIDRCLAAATFKECLLLSPKHYDLPPYIQQIPIAPLNSVAAYSEFMINELGKYFSGSHVLVVQWDSWILNPGCWDASFLQYDYIGAPWRHHHVVGGNGGFSLRSRKLVDAVRRLCMAETHPEDRCICIHHADTLIKQYGIHFAPRELATRFSFENKVPPHPTFGFHGFFNFNHIFSRSDLIAYFSSCDDVLFLGPAGRSLIKSLYRTGDYKTADIIIKKRLQKAPWKVALKTTWLALRRYVHQWSRHTIA